MTAVIVRVPESWHFEGKIDWHYDWIAIPVNPSWHAENPANSEAYFQYEALSLVSVDASPRWKPYLHNPKPGERWSLGPIYMEPAPPLQALAAFIKKTRSDVSNLKWLGEQDLPDLAKALRLPRQPNQHGYAIKIGYDLNGKPVEEAFFGVFYRNQAGTEGVQLGPMSTGANEFIQTNWGFQPLLSFRAPAGTLEKRMPVYCLIAKSVQYDPKWLARDAAINATLNQMFAQKLKEGYDQIRATQAMMDHLMKDQANFLANVERQEQAMMASGGSSGGGVDGLLRGDGGRSSSDQFSDLIRGVDTVNDPSTGGTKQLSYSEGSYHFTDGFGNYRTYDNPNDTPENHNENGTWQLMTVAK